MAYPTDIDSFANPLGTNLQSSPDHAQLHRQVGSAVMAIEPKLGVSAGSPTLNRVLVGSGNGTSIWGTQVNNLGLGTPTIGTPAITGGSHNAATLGTPALTGGTINTATINNAVVGTPLVTGGTINSAKLGTPTIGTVAVSGTTTPLSIGAALAPTVTTLTDAPSGTIAWNSQVAQLFHLILGTAGANRTMGTPANPLDGQALILRVKQNAANTGTIIWPSIFRFSQNIDSTTGTASSYNYYAWRYNGIDTRWDQQGVVVNLSI